MRTRNDTRPALDPALRFALWLHAIYLALFTALAAWASALTPWLVRELRVPVWPPSAPLGAWLERVALLPLYRYDVVWYVGIAKHGYGHRVGDIAFYPLYPLLVGLVGRGLGGRYLLAGWLVAQVCCVAMLVVLYRLVRLDHEEAVARRTTLFLLGSPLGFAFLLPYTESLLLLGIVGALYAGRRGRWWLAGLAAAGAALTKQPGALVLPALLWELWQQRRDALRASGPRAMLGPLAALSLAPAGLLAWNVYAAASSGAPLPWADPPALVSRILLSSSLERVWMHSLGWPGAPLVVAVQQLQQEPSFYLLLNVALVLALSALTIAAARRARPSYAIYSVLVLALRLMVVYPLLPLMAAARHLTLIFPVFIQLAVWGRSRAVATLVLALSSLLWALIGSMYVRNAFVP